ncbi:universal stress protein [Serratia rhizosphaerae]|uniref:Universal stress protein n=1 Tax=Serratia rhizosphaerae TaxID=2597702 RepID=A0ABX6GRQ7_9GAMM|nr:MULTISPECIES: universal stress protein [Serratia]MBU3895144.1 universal stress protein [Serratia rubidaea]AVJ18259.1 universal stress protein UspA [Serratia sp. MYb239]MCA4824209.1 universal stress protein [Serratia rubidaea]MEB6336587.1 universal stress protein [Serratia rhizosphaerae]QHA88927.1 universal stress protein UspA [Serratia rhizosphaerae]
MSSYQHIAVATSLLDEERLLIDKGIALASALGAKLSLIYVDEHHASYYSELGRPVANFSETQFEEKIRTEMQPLLQAASYPIAEVIIRRGELAYELKYAAAEKGIDLFIFGHHQDLWGNLFSSARNAINTLHTDILVVPIRK